MKYPTVQAIIDELLDWDDLYILENYLDEKESPMALEDIDFKPRHRAVPKGPVYRAVSNAERRLPKMGPQYLLPPSAWTFTRNVALDFAELQGDDEHRYAVILRVQPNPEQVLVYLPATIKDFEAKNDADELFSSTIHTIKSEDEVVLYRLKPSDVSVEGVYDRETEKLLKGRGLK
jgi:hypothetical protein